MMMCQAKWCPLICTYSITQILASTFYLFVNNSAYVPVLYNNKQLKCFSNKLKLTYLREITVVKTS